MITKFAISFKGGTCSKVSFRVVVKNTIRRINNFNMTVIILIFW